MRRTVLRWVGSCLPMVLCWGTWLISGSVSAVACAGVAYVLGLLVALAIATWA